jgi:hypothetical protein
MCMHDFLGLFPEARNRSKFFFLPFSPVLHQNVTGIKNKIFIKNQLTLMYSLSTVDYNWRIYRNTGYRFDIHLWRY